MERPTIAHIVSPYLFQTGSWIYTQLKTVPALRPIVLTDRIENLDQFPFDPIFQYKSPIPGKGRYPNYARLVYETALRRRERFYVDVIRQQCAAVIHAHFGPQGYRTLPVQKATKLPLVTTFYGFDVAGIPNRDPRWRKRYRELFAAGTLFLAEGPHLAQSLVDQGCSPQKIRVQHLGVNLERIPFSEHHFTTDGPQRILMVNRFREKKGIPYGIAAFALIGSLFPRAELRVLGMAVDAEEERILRQCKALAASSGVGDRVHFLGGVTYSVYLEELTQAHVFLAPSVHASDGDSEGGAPVSLIEAAAAGLPAVASRHCDIPEVVEDEKTGLLAEERDVEGLARGIAVLLSNPEMAAAMGRAARSHVETGYDYNRQGMLLTDVYRSLART